MCNLSFVQIDEGYLDVAFANVFRVPESFRCSSFNETTQLFACHFCDRVDTVDSMLLVNFSDTGTRQSFRFFVDILVFLPCEI